MTPHKHAEVIKAWADGAAIEVCETDGNEDVWIELDSPSWNVSREYRVKPEPKSPGQIWFEVSYPSYEWDRCTQSYYHELAAKFLAAIKEIE